MKIFVQILSVFAFVSTIYGDRQQLNLLLVMESNDAVPALSLRVQKLFLKNIVSVFQPIGKCDIEVALLNYGNMAKVEWGFNSEESSNPGKIMSGISNAAEIGGDTPSMVPALQAAANMFDDNSKKPNVAVIIRSSSSPEPNENDAGDDGQANLEQAAAALRSKAEVIVIKISDKTDADEINTIIDNDPERMLSENDFSILETMLLSFVQSVESDEECNAG